MRPKTTIFLVISTLLLGINAHASWLSQWQLTYQPLMRTYVCPAWQRAQHHMLNNRWKYLGLAAAGIGARCWHYNSRTSQNLPKQCSQITSHILSFTNLQNSDLNIITAAKQYYKTIIADHTSKNEILDERHITASWPQSVVSYLKKNSVDRNLQSQLDDIMINKKLLLALHQMYTYPRRTTSFKETFYHKDMSNSHTSAQVIDQYIADACGLQFFLKGNVFTLKQFPNLIFKMALPPDVRLTEQININRVYYANVLKRYFGENTPSDEYVTLVVPRKQLYIVPQTAQLPGGLAPKAIVVAEKINLHNAQSYRDVAHLRESGSISENDWRIKAVNKLINHGKYLDPLPQFYLQNIYFREDSKGNRQIIVLDTKFVNLETADHAKFRNIIPLFTTNTWGMVIHKNNILRRIMRYFSLLGNNTRT
jgi:hypothetical protein